MIANLVLQEAAIVLLYILWQVGIEHERWNRGISWRSLSSERFTKVGWITGFSIPCDRNHLQIDGTTETVMNSAPLEEKLKAFNFNVLTINGHDLDAIESAIAAFRAENEKPTCIILDTLKGKGISFMENSVDWHGKGPNDEEYAQAMQELNAAYAALEEEDK